MTKITSMEATYARNRPPEADVLSDVLRAVRLTGALFYDNEAHAPWVSETPDVKEYGHLAMPGAELVIPFKVVMTGSCFAELVDEPGEPIRLVAGDAVVISRGARHVLASAPGMREDEETFDAEEYRHPADGLVRLALINENAAGDGCRFVCGFFGCDLGPFNPLIAALPPLWRAPISASQVMIETAIAETTRSTTGGGSLLQKLGELLFIEVIRAYIDRLPDASRGWLNGLRDRHVGASLQLIHRHPAREWTIEHLAREVGVSRSVFAERFTHHVGLSPMSYLGRWRMQLAARQLEDSDVSVAQAAAAVGYGSEAAFRRSFKRLVGVSPAEWRRARTAHDGETATGMARESETH